MTHHFSALGRCNHWMLFCWILGGLIAVVPTAFTLDSCSALAADEPGSKAGGWQLQADPPTEQIEWPEKLTLGIAQPQQSEEILFPLARSPFCLVNLKPYESAQAELWDLRKNKRVGAIQGTPQQAVDRALSPDGKYLAIAVLDREKANDVEVWSLSTGKKLCQFQAADRKHSLTYLNFAGPDELIVFTLGDTGGKSTARMSIRDANTGKELRDIKIQNNIGNKKQTDISPGRTYLATVYWGEAAIYDLNTGEKVGAIKPGDKTEAGELASISSVRFSPDGKEIAVYGEGQRAGIITVYDLATGNQTARLELSGAMKSSLQHPASYLGPPIEFTADPPGFLWYGSAVVDRETSALVWQYKQGILEFSHWPRILTPSGLIVSMGGHGARKIMVAPFPSRELAQAMEDYRSEKPALVKPGEKVKVKITVGPVRSGTKEAALKALQEVLAERLAEDGLEVDDSGSTLFTFKYSEREGKELKEVKGGDFLGRGGKETGRTVQSTAADVEISWTSKDGKTKIYEHKFDYDPSVLIVRSNEEVNATAARNSVFASLKVYLAGLPMPYYVPLEKGGQTLPLVTNSALAAPPSKADMLKSKIDAKKKTAKK